MVNALECWMCCSAHSVAAWPLKCFQIHENMLSFTLYLKREIFLTHLSSNSWHLLFPSCLKSNLNVQIPMHPEWCKQLSDHQYEFQKAWFTRELLLYAIICGPPHCDHGESFVIALDKVLERVPYGMRLLAKLLPKAFLPSFPLWQTHLKLSLWQNCLCCCGWDNFVLFSHWLWNSLRFCPLLCILSAISVVR